LISAFVERWHAETNSFHLPIGEMIITLDDVSSLLHLPILGQFPTYVPLEYNGAATILTELLGVEEARGKTEMRQCRRPRTIELASRYICGMLRSRGLEVCY